MKIVEIKNNKAILNDGSTIDLRKIKTVPEQQTEQEKKTEEKAVEKEKRQARVVRKVAREGIEINQNVIPRAQRIREPSAKKLENIAR